MKDLIAKIFGTSSSITPTGQLGGIEGINKLANNFELVEGNAQYPTYLVAVGQVKSGEQVYDIRTALNLRNNDIEFSTNMGQIPNSAFGCAVVDRLNRRLAGKFVALDAERPSKLDVVYATKKPSGWLNRERVRAELEDHADHKIIVDPVLKDSFNWQPKPELPHSGVRGAAQEIVDSRIDLQRKLQDKFNFSQYLPTPLSSSDK